MAADQGSSSPLMDLNDDVQDLIFAKPRGCCVWIPCFGGGRSPARGSIWWQRMRPANDDPWWSRGWKKVREWSEIVAGPRWKTFIRRFNRNDNRAFGYKQAGKFHYDELSYALNFDDGPGRRGGLDDGDDEDLLRRDFSSRYASVPASAKSSMDFGRDCPGPSFT